MKVDIVAIGNSKGICIPKELLEQCGFGKNVEITVDGDRIIPGPTRPVRSGWDESFKALREVKYDGWLTIESFGFALGELSAAASIWRDLAPTPETIAFEGVKFLKSLS